MSVHLSLGKGVCGPQGVRGRHRPLLQGRGHLVSKASSFLLLFPPQERKTFLLRFLVHLVSESSSKPSTQRWRKNNSRLLQEPLYLGFLLLPCRRSAGILVKSFSLGWPWGFLPDPTKALLPCSTVLFSFLFIHCSFSFLFSPGFRNRTRAPHKEVVFLTWSHLRCLLSGHFFRRRLCGLAGGHREAFRALEAAGTLRGSPENKGRRWGRAGSPVGSAHSSLRGALWKMYF